jgi:carbon storage regulator
MLILSRKENQKIRIGNDIVINIVAISDNNVRIGIEADKKVKIYREEIYESIKSHTKEAANQMKVVVPKEIPKLTLNKITKDDKKK